MTKNTQSYVYQKWLLKAVGLNIIYIFPLCLARQLKFYFQLASGFLKCELEADKIFLLNFHFKS